MAVLSNADYTQIKQLVQSRSGLRTTFKTWALTKTQYKNLFQETEDYLVNAFSVRPAVSYKATLEAIDASVTNAQAKAVDDAYTLWKARNI
jgi:hypothetical protein